MGDGDIPQTLELTPGLVVMPPGWGESVATDPSPIQSFVLGWMEALEDAAISWAILRGAEGLPAFTRYDIDLLIQPRDKERVVELIHAAGTKHGWRLMGSIYKAHYTCLMYMRTEGAQHHFLPIDLFTALEYRGLHYFDGAHALAQRVRNPASVWTLPPGLNAAITVLKEWLPHGVVKANSHAAVQANVAADRTGFAARLTDAVGPRVAEQLVNQVERNEWTLTPRLHRRVRAEVRRRSPHRFVEFSRMLRCNLRHLTQPSLSAVVALAGADGSGKSTLAERMMLARYRRPFKACRYVHGNIGVLPRFRDIRAACCRWMGRPAQTVVNADTTLKGMMTPIAPWRSMVLSAYYALDLCIARFLIRRWRGQWSLVVMDRSFYDYYYQLGHRSCPEWWLNWMAVLIPKPDLLLYVRGAPEEIHARKPELTATEIEREQELLDALTGRLSFAQTVDGTAGVEHMVNQAVEKLDQVWMDQECPQHASR